MTLSLLFHEIILIIFIMCNKNRSPTSYENTALRDDFKKLKTILKPFSGKGEIK